MTLNLKTEKGLEIFFRLAENADVLLEGFRPGVVDKLGVGYEAVCKINPRVIYCSITGFGQDGPYRDRVGHDVNYLSFAGVLDLIGEAGRPPSIPGVQFADIAGGGMNAAMGILLALFARQNTGKGQYIDISMTDGMVGLLSAVQFFQQLTGKAPARSNSLLSHRYACYNTYETADGRYLSIGAVEYRFWKQLCEYLGVPEFSDLQYDEARRTELIDFMRKAIKQKTLDEWDRDMGNLDLCWGRIQNLDEVLQDRLFREREMVVALKDKDGKETLALGVPIKLSETPGSVRTAPDFFGESTAAILKGLGYSSDQIKEFSETGVI